MDQRQVVAEWAWISKEPGSPEDYRVLAASTGPIDAPGFARAYVAGVPGFSTPQNAPMAAPWVTFGAHPTSVQRRMVSVSAQDHWQGLDQAGRPIWPRRFFLCWYDDITAARPTYRTLWNVMAPMDLPRPDRRPVPVAIGPQPLNDVVAAIGTIGFERAAAIAAALLDGPVAVTGTAALFLTDTSAALDRLALLDAVAALLPYGFRADLSVSTAVDNTVAHRIRLVLADFAGDSQQAAALRGTLVTPRSECARDYLGLLLEKERWDGLNTVVGYLLDATNACSFGRPETAVELLDGLNRHGHRLRTAGKGAESLELSRAFFRDGPEVEQAWRSPVMDGQTRAKLLRPFLDAPADQTLRRYWHVVADDYGALVSERLDGGDIAAAVRALEVAESQSGAAAADRLLCQLVAPPRLPGRSWSRDIAARAGLLRQRAVPARGTFGVTRAGLRTGQSTGWQARLVRELLSSELTEDPTAARARAWASWLSRPPAGDSPPKTAAPDWVAALGYMLAGTGGGGVPDQVRSLIGQDAVWAGIALGLASASDRRLAHDFWRRLAAAQPALRPVLAVSLLRDAIEQVIVDPTALDRYADERFGVAGSELALAMYSARRSGIPVPQIIGVMRDTSVESVTLTGKLGHRQLDDVLRELGFLLAHPERDDGGAAAGDEAADRRVGAQPVLLEFRQLICAGSLGAGYGAEFRSFLDRRLRDEQAASRRLRRLFRPSGRWRMRPFVPAPSAAAEEE